MTLGSNCEAPLALFRDVSEKSVAPCNNISSLGSASGDVLPNAVDLSADAAATMEAHRSWIDAAHEAVMGSQPFHLSVRKTFVELQVSVSTSSTLGGHANVMLWVVIIISCSCKCCSRGAAAHWSSFCDQNPTAGAQD